MSDTGRRADVRAFEAELDRLEGEGVLSLEPALRERIRLHHASLGAAGPTSGTADRGAVARLSTGMRIATLLGAIALSAAYALLIDSIWATLPMSVQLPLVIVPPILLAWLTAVAKHREPSGYIASIAATVAIIAFAVNLVVLGSLFNLPDTRHAFLAIGAFAMVLAYGHRLSLALVLGIAGVGLWLWSLASVPTGAWWTSAFENLEPLALVGVLSMLLARRLGMRHAFDDEYRGLGAMACAAALLILGQTANASALPLDDHLVEGLYQVAGATAFVAMVVTGIRRDWPELVRVGTGAGLIFLFLRLVDWFWDWLPKWLFFLIVGAAAVVVVLMLRRIRIGREAR